MISDAWAARESRGTPDTSWHAVPCVPIVVALISVVACGGVPTRPTQEDRFPLYSGQWRGTINGIEVVLQIQAERGFAVASLRGTGTAVKSATGESARLQLVGSAALEYTASPAYINFSTADELSPDGRAIVRLGQFVGRFTGDILEDQRTWRGQFDGSRTTYASLFGEQATAVTFIKD
jgi:hypothetical protein